MPEAAVTRVADNCSLMLLSGKYHEFPEGASSDPGIAGGPQAKGSNFYLSYWFFCRPTYNCLTVYGDAFAAVYHAGQKETYSCDFKAKIWIVCGDGCVADTEREGNTEFQLGPLNISSKITPKFRGGLVTIDVSVDVSLHEESLSESTTGKKVDVKVKSSLPGGALSAEDDLEKSSSEKHKDPPINVSTHAEMGTYQWECSKIDEDRVVPVFEGPKQEQPKEQPHERPKLGANRG